MPVFLLKKIIPGYENAADPRVRIRYGKLAGITGICANLILFAAKILIGFLSGSIAIVADGVNNLSDAASSAILLVGFRLAAAPGDKQHPYGHARIEYLTGLFISVIIILIGAKLLTSSFERILHPVSVEFSYAALIVLAAAIPVKVWLARFTVKIGKTIQSGTLKAAGADSRNDVIATSAVLAGLLAGHFTGLRIDGWLGCFVAVFIIVAGIQLIRETSDPLLGKAPDPALVAAIKDMILKAEAVVGMHDLVIHDYGPGRTFASVHAEVDVHDDFLKCHDIIDNVEREAAGKLGISLVIHMDPTDTTDPLTLEIRALLETLILGMDGVVGIHDLRLVKGFTHTNVVFDVVLSPACSLPREEIRQRLEAGLTAENPNYFLVVVFDTDFTDTVKG
ncbi:MAG: cation diffusion facilitator family transporter [Clostridiales Family XIII bacterium]|jgi:cation diffusion facilitator family transporter|nr:cation diffusion facilitator family transporter [Clostridiales Family XIII bacterium]